MKKNTSNSFEVYLAINGKVAASGSVNVADAPLLSESLVTLHSEDEVEFCVNWDNPSFGVLIRLGNDVVEEILPGRTRNKASIERWFQGCLGESSLVVEAQEEFDEAPRIVYQQDLLIEPRAETAQDFKSMIDDLMEIHEGLAQDVLSRGFVRKTLVREIPKLMVPDAMLTKLTEILERLSKGIGEIAVQPSSMLYQKTLQTPIRSGDRISAATLRSIARDGLIVPSGQLRLDPFAKARVSRPALSEDIPEHRHMAFRIRRLASTAYRIKDHCERSAKIIEADEEKWGQKRAGQPSVYELVGLPRVNLLKEYSRKADNLARKFFNLVRYNSFLEGAGQPRTPFEPTPLFHGRPTYLSVYRALRDAEHVLGGMVDGDAVRVYFRSLHKLYEYWCFIRTVYCLRAWFGPPEPSATFSFIDEVYRPEFTPGQAFEFNTGVCCKVRVTYEPEIKPWDKARAQGEILGATLTTTALRPDIFIEILHHEEHVAAMVLDAKSGDFFHRKKLREISDYARQILDVKKGTQPVRQVFLLHRDRSKRPESNLPGYFEGQSLMTNLNVIGSAPCFPDNNRHKTFSLHTVLFNFLAANGVEISLEEGVS